MDSMFQAMKPFIMEEDADPLTAIILSEIGRISGGTFD